MKLRLCVVRLFLGVVIFGIIIAASAYIVKKDIAVSASNNAHTVPVATGGTCEKGYGAGWYDCVTNFCNTQGLYCCPPGYPYLNHCDCQCYKSNDFRGAETEQGRNCQSYSNCNY